jgi:hypothetical protein
VAQAAEDRAAVDLADEPASEGAVDAGSKELPLINRWSLPLTLNTTRAENVES